MISAAQVHLALNHLPMGLALVGVPLLGIALWRRSSELKAVGSLLLILAAVAAVPTFLSGEPAEEIVEHLPGVSKDVIHGHEESGEIALIWSGVLGALVLGAMCFERFKRPLPSSVWWGLVLMGAVCLGIFVRTAHLGGLIRHEEIRGATGMEFPADSGGLRARIPDSLTHRGSVVPARAGLNPRKSMVRLGFMRYPPPW
jgi:uncharacterized membrane protein